MTAFADSSALVKLYADESGSDVVRNLGVLVVSALARVEVPAAIWRKVRTGELDAASAQVLVEEFEADYYGEEDQAERFVAVGVDDDLLGAAAGLAARHSLRAYDAVQLSSALAVRQSAPQCHTFAAFARHLCVAAATEGFRIL
jgi:predicted nucleic acid-binding protein